MVLSCHDCANVLLYTDMKRLVNILSWTISFMLLSLLTAEAQVTKYSLPEGNLKWSYTKPVNAKMCLPAAFTDEEGNVMGAYRIDGKSYQTNKRRKVSLKGETFFISSSWQSGNGFQQLTLVYNKSVPVQEGRDLRKCKRRALCKSKGETFILESDYRMTLYDFACECSKQCDYAVYLDMGEYGYGYIKNGNTTKHLHIWGYATKYKQTNWLYIE